MGKAKPAAAPGLTEIKQAVLVAVRSLYAQDDALLHRDASEQSITHRLAVHLQESFPDWCVDCEYNRREGDVKRLQVPFGTVNPNNLKAKKVIPDVIVHRRGSRKNLLVVEVKNENGGDETFDDEKLRAFGQDPDFAYRFGIFLRLGPQGCTRVQAYQNEAGEK